MNDIVWIGPSDEHAPFVGIIITVLGKHMKPAAYENRGRRIVARRCPVLLPKEPFCGHPILWRIRRFLRLAIWLPIRRIFAKRCNFIPRRRLGFRFRFLDALGSIMIISARSTSYLLPLRPAYLVAARSPRAVRRPSRADTDLRLPRRLR